MFLEVWDLIQNKQIEIALQKLNELKISDEYLGHLALIMHAEAALSLQNFSQSLDLAHKALIYFFSHPYTLEELFKDHSDLGVNFLEKCLVYWIQARALAGQQRWLESITLAKKALEEWEFYFISRRPFLHFEELAKKWDYLPQHIQQHLIFLTQIVKEKPTSKELLELLVSDDFKQTVHHDSKTNELSTKTPFVDVCIASCGDGHWLKLTIDSILENANYDNYKITLVYQKKNPENPVDEFLQQPFYAEHPKLELLIYDHPIGADNAKQIGYDRGSGELIISLDAHVITCHDFIKKTVDVFYQNSEVSFLGYGIVNAHLDHTLHNYFFNEIPHWINGVMSPTAIMYGNPRWMIPEKPGLYRRQTMIGAAFCITRKLFYKIGGYLLKDRSWGDKVLCLNAYLYGYYTYAHADLICIHKWHSDPPLSVNAWKETDPKIAALENVPGSSLTVGYFYFSQRYFEEYFVPWIKQLCGETFEWHWQRFQEKLPELEAKKKAFWKEAEKSLREYWLEFGDYIWARLSPVERQCLFPYIPPP